jgi:hypothetical protein
LCFLVKFTAPGKAPQTFGEIVATMADVGQPIIVGLELNSAEQGRLEAYLASKGTPSDRRHLVQGSDWKIHDGRGSTAMLALIEHLRRLSQEHQNLRVVAFAPTFEPQNESETGYNRRMADNIMTAAKGANALVLILVGNIHAMRSPLPAEGGNRGFRPMAMNLPASATLSVRFDSAGGRAWTCQENAVGKDECGGPCNGTRQRETEGQFRTFPYTT